MQAVRLDGPNIPGRQGRGAAGFRFTGAVTRVTQLVLEGEELDKRL